MGTDHDYASKIWLRDLQRDSEARRSLLLTFLTASIFAWLVATVAGLV